MAQKILLVDDSDDFREAVKSRLAASGYEVTEATDGSKALEAMKSQIPDLIILDIKMPQMDGYTFIKNLEKEGKDVPVIILTAYRDMESLFKMEGISDFFLKSDDMGVLVKKINVLLSTGNQ